ncbi:MAG: flavin reductase family protein [Planctomycetota bacterium]|nr:flavin reductase family protein [Planctomycetota bacterium]
MYYEPAKGDHGLERDPFKALVVPRPIGWISTVSKEGVANLAPYSFFNAVASRPPYVMFSSETAKDSMRNAEETGEFVCCLATWDLRAQMNATAAPVAPGVDEFALTGLTPVASTSVRPPRVKESPVALECRWWKTLALPGAGERDGPSAHVVLGRVVGVHVDDAFLDGGLVDSAAMRPIARLGYMNYAVVNPEAVFTIERPSCPAEDPGGPPARA